MALEMTLLRPNLVHEHLNYVIEINIQYEFHDFNIL